MTLPPKEAKAVALATVAAAVAIAGQVASYMSRNSGVNWGQANHSLLLTIHRDIAVLNQGITNALSGIVDIQRMLYEGFTEIRLRDQQRLRGDVNAKSAAYLSLLARYKSQHGENYQDYIHSPEHTDIRDFERIYEPIINAFEYIDDAGDGHVRRHEEFNVMTVAIAQPALIGLKADLDRSPTNVRNVVQDLNQYFREAADPDHAGSVRAKINQDIHDLRTTEQEVLPNIGNSFNAKGVIYETKFYPVRNRCETYNIDKDYTKYDFTEVDCSTENARKGASAPTSSTPSRTRWKRTISRECGRSRSTCTKPISPT
jgi:hypothetical protein